MIYDITKTTPPRDANPRQGLGDPATVALTDEQRHVSARTPPALRTFRVENLGCRVQVPKRPMARTMRSDTAFVESWGLVIISFATIIVLLRKRHLSVLPAGECRHKITWRIPVPLSFLACRGIVRRFLVRLCKSNNIFLNCQIIRTKNDHKNRHR